MFYQQFVVNISVSEVFIEVSKKNIETQAFEMPKIQYSARIRHPLAADFVWK